jgi:hypothetical protein
MVKEAWELPKETQVVKKFCWEPANPKNAVDGQNPGPGLCLPVQSNHDPKITSYVYSASRANDEMGHGHLPVGFGMLFESYGKYDLPD